MILEMEVEFHKEGARKSVHCTHSRHALSTGIHPVPTLSGHLLMLMQNHRNECMHCSRDVLGHVRDDHQALRASTDCTVCMSLTIMHGLLFP